MSISLHPRFHSPLPEQKHNALDVLLLQMREQAMDDVIAGIAELSDKFGAQSVDKDQVR